MSNKTLAEIKSLVLRETTRLPDRIRQDLESALTFCVTSNRKTGEEYIVDPLTVRIITQKLCELYTNIEAASELVELLFYVSGNSRRLYMVMDSRSHLHHSESI